MRKRFIDYSNKNFHLSGTVLLHYRIIFEDSNKNATVSSATNCCRVPVNPLTFDAHCCHMGTAIKHPVLDQVRPLFVIFDIRAL